MKKILVALLVVFLGVAMLTSCGEKKEEATTTDPTATEATTTDPATTDATLTDPATTDATTTKPAAEGVLEINELTLTPAGGWTGTADKDNSMIMINKSLEEAMTLLAIKTMGTMTLDAVVKGMKENDLKAFGEIKEEKVTYGTLEFAKLDYKVADKDVTAFYAVAKDFMLNITINGGMTPEVESMLNSIVIK